MDRAVVTIPGFQEIKQIVRILHPLSARIGAEPAHAKPLCFDDSRDSKNDSIWAARREMQVPLDAMHRASMGATDGQRNFAEMRKTQGKPGFLSGEDRNRTIAKYYRNSQVLPLGGADSGAVVLTPEDFTSSTSVLMDSDLTAIIEAWPTLDTSVRKSILEMICRCS
jgi:hypothetical protein